MWQKVNQRIAQALQNIRQAFRVVTGSANSTTKVQMIQLSGLAGERLDGAEYFQHYGYTSNPPAGCMGIAVPLNGQTSHTVIVATEHGGYRLTALKTGEVALYTDEGTRIVLKRGKIIEATCDVYRVKCKTYEVDAEESADFTTPKVTASQQVIATGKISGNGGMDIKGGGDGATATFEGTLRQTAGNYETDGDVKAGTISLTGHDHPNGNGGKPTGHPIP
ncbi:phage baseplate assembly protein V [Serratia sp. JSRIV001]|uniref:phage baseplate assembly protein V n=1 Tax=unclassified Serratia (in: enterobacteria) TaxID=2647522 RepID=UPI001CBD4AA6|nr:MULTISPECIES: phage baseplate assembly protein V [unclassified Serratia (in: enterobacteria)]UAN46998.1 phage baseplate assembly protein V [Serratia sp. JSRIV001]UAN55439.1 phage baseplate assembly protein V [Serratia sp. JSRIV004]UAN57252.1 phage baseplate assembly protein V [Serratia sp. JSRIV004]